MAAQEKWTTAKISIDSAVKGSAKPLSPHRDFVAKSEKWRRTYMETWMYISQLSDKLPSLHSR